jgi:hypothetical protein
MPSPLEPPPIDVTQLSRPSIARYRDLVAGLMTCDQQLQDGSLSPLHAAVGALKVVSEFIGSDVRLRNAGVSIALRRLLAALGDRAQGANPDMLSANRDGKHGTPTNLSAHTLRGCTVSALNGLIEAGMRPRDAAQWMEREYSRLKVRYEGKPVTDRQLRQWREQTGDSAPEASDEAVRVAAEIRKSLPTDQLTALQLAQYFARAVGLTVKRYG